MHVRSLAVLFLVGCGGDGKTADSGASETSTPSATSTPTTTPPTATTSPTPSPSGTPTTSPTTVTTTSYGGESRPICGADVAAEMVAVCLQVVGDPLVVDGYDAALAIEGALVEVGSSLTLSGSVPWAGTWSDWACDEAVHDHRVRIDGIDGTKWLFGWGTESPADMLSSAYIDTGMDVTLAVTDGTWGYGIKRTIHLADERGLLFAEELDDRLPSAAERGGLEVDRSSLDSCYDPFGAWGFDEHYAVTFSDGTTEARLFSGGDVLLDGGVSDLGVYLAGSVWNLECTDGCGYDNWIVWRGGPVR
jgi:hypothetical protein